MKTELLKEVAPTGVVRAAINLSNMLLVTGRSATGEPEGVAPDMARAFADHVGAKVEFVPFPSPGAVADQARNGIWDIALIGAEPQRAEWIAFSPAYVEIKATYLVPAGSPIDTLSAVDVEGVRIASMARAAYDLWLDRNIHHATLIRADSVDASFELFASRRLEALAGLEPKLHSDRQKLPGSRILDGHFMSVQQAIGTPRANVRAAIAIREFVDNAKATGLVAKLIEKHAVTGLSVPDDARG